VVPGSASVAATRDRVSCSLTESVAVAPPPSEVICGAKRLAASRSRRRSANAGSRSACPCCPNGDHNVAADALQRVCVMVMEEHRSVVSTTAIDRVRAPSADEDVVERVAVSVSLPSPAIAFSDIRSSPIVRTDR